MSKSIRLILLCLLIGVILPVIGLSATQIRLTVQTGEVNAYLSVRSEASSSHALRAVIAEHRFDKLENAVLTLTFTGKQSFERSYPYSEWISQSSLYAGGDRYVPDSGVRMYAVELPGISNGSWEQCRLRLTQNNKTIREASISYDELCKKSGLVLLPVWNGSTADWMAQIPDNVSLSDLTIPGTHDSGAANGVLLGIGKCQTLSIADQLACGVRFLDIRIKIDNGELKVYHGVLYQQISFADVRKVCTDFLKAHPNEVILMSIKQEENDNSGFAAAVKAAIEKDSDYWYTGSSLPALGQARGKIVLFARYNSGGLGINCNSGWKDNTDFTMNNGVPMKVQDYYSVGDAENIETKWNKIRTLAEYAHSSSKGKTFCLNFTSGYTGSFGITDVSNVINPKLSAYFAAAEQGCYGTYAIDFVTPELAAALIAVNFPKGE